MIRNNAADDTYYKEILIHIRFDLEMILTAPMLKRRNDKKSKEFMIARINEAVEKIDRAVAGT